jgi:hypothetical protein
MQITFLVKFLISLPQIGVFFFKLIIIIMHQKASQTISFTHKKKELRKQYFISHKGISMFCLVSFNQLVLLYTTMIMAMIEYYLTK